jgi:alkanesulfonate monooxygenase SsuD/methylene tetrahydromethanopterin reductase-like flavin-dependent oxidoreductase (luciferase family)
VPPPICLVTREKSLQLSGRVADGTLLCEPSTPDYIRSARSHIDRGRAAAGRSDPHRVTAYVLLGVDDTGQAAVRHELANVLALRGETPQFSVPGLMQDIGALIKAHPDPAAMAHALPADWTHMLAATGTPDEIAESIRAMAAAGANSIVLNPPFDADVTEHQLQLFARDVLPLLRH